MRSAKLIIFVAMALMLLALTSAHSAPPCPNNPPLQADGIPQDDDFCGTRGLKSFAHMAWQTFKILVWPAESRGNPDKKRSITDMSGPRVFETYKSDWEVFPTIPPGGTLEHLPF